jgi:hypothetical protein
MFRVLSIVAIRSRVYLRWPDRKRAPACAVAGLALVLALAACGGGGGGGPKQPTGHLVSGTGFTFLAPDGWDVTVGARQATARKDATTLVSVTVLPLVKPYEPRLFPRVIVELDRVAGTLAGRLHGSVRSRRTATVAGRRVRVYELVHGRLVDRLTFVLRGRTEFLLTCRWRGTDGAPAACGQLASTFRLGAA